jgi:23S rRNA-/tRNA-specific pseudouridylate synthase
MFTLILFQAVNIFYIIFGVRNRVNNQKYRIAFEDPSLLIVDKPQGLATSQGEQVSLCGLIFADFPHLQHIEGFRASEGGLLNR